MVEQVLAVLRQEKVSSAVLALVVFGLLWAQSWASGEFARREDFSALRESIEISDASQIVRDTRLELTITQAHGGSEGEVSRLAGKMAQAKIYKQCLVDQRPNCEHLRSID